MKIWTFILVLVLLSESALAENVNITLEQHSANSSTIDLYIFSYSALSNPVEEHSTNSSGLIIAIFSYSPLSKPLDSHSTNSSHILLKTFIYSALSKPLEHHSTNSSAITLSTFTYTPLSKKIESHTTNSSPINVNPGRKVDFTGEEFSFSVKREFSSVEVQIKNYAEGEFSNITAEVVDPEEPMSFIGPGELIEQISIKAGETKNLTIGLTLSQAKKLTYTHKIRLYCNSLVMDESSITLNLPSWDNYKIATSQDEWDISMSKNHSSLDVSSREINWTFYRRPALKKNMSLVLDYIDYKDLVGEHQTTSNETYLNQLEYNIWDRYTDLESKRYQLWDELQNASDVAILINGFYKDTLLLMDNLKEVAYLEGVNFTLKEIEKYRVLLIPSGRLHNLHSGFKTRLEDYVKGGGTLLVFAQQNGNDYGLLP